MAMKGTKMAKLGAIIFTYIVILVGIILYGVFAKQRCSVSYGGDSYSCDDFIATFGSSSLSVSTTCSNIYHYKIDLFGVTWNQYCPWYSRDVGLGEAALVLSAIFVTIVLLKKQVKLGAQQAQIRIALGVVCSILLFAAIITSFVDLFDLKIEDTGVSGITVDRHVYKANGAMVILTLILVLARTAWDIKKFLTKGGKSSKVTKVVSPSHESAPIQVQAY